MTNRALRILFIAATVSIVVYMSIFALLNADKEKRISEILEQKMQNLEVHYRLSEKYFQDIVDVATALILQDKETRDILRAFRKKLSKKRAARLRARLYKKLQKTYALLRRFGVLQMHFVDADSVTILRMHKPSKFGDDLYELKYSFRQTNLTRESYSGIEGGKTFPSYRNVRPLYDSNKEYLGALDIAFSPEIIQKNLLETSNVHSHFLVHRSLLQQREWKREDGVENYVPSIESDEYVMFTDPKDEKNCSAECDKEILMFIAHERGYIQEKMHRHEKFSLYTLTNSQAVIVSFLPLKSIEGKYVAYLVSYSSSVALYKLVEDFYIINMVIILMMFLVVYIAYKSYFYNYELKHERNRYQLLASYDPLTKLPNRNMLFEKLKEIKARAERESTKFALLFLDLDNFKSINDTHGHQEGDRVLQYVAKVLRKILRAEDTLARFGGDEFVIVVEEFEHIRDVSKIANKIIEKLKEPVDFGYAKYYIGASIGISIFPDDSKDEHELIRYADTAMYKAKKRGRNRVEFYSQEMGIEVLAKLTLENEMRYGIENDEFEVFYQPQIDARNGSLVGLEALVRWRHPKRGMIYPSEFIPVAEESQLIVELDRYLMRKAMHQMAYWKQHDYPVERISLNLSIKELQKSDFINDLKFSLFNANCDARWIELEITEGLIMVDTQNAISKLTELSNLGVKIAIDDFGTGYSSLSYLKKLPINKLKVDKSFVDDMLSDNDSQVIVRTIITLAQNLHLEVLAEGVESEEQKEFLLKNGCYVIQGYYYSKPLSAREVEERYFAGPR